MQINVLFKGSNTREAQSSRSIWAAAVGAGSDDHAGEQDVPLNIHIYVLFSPNLWAIWVKKWAEHGDV